MDLPLDRDGAADQRPAVALVSLGCSKNQVDSERMLGGLVARGYRYEADSTRADLVVINTCGFIGPAKDQSIETIVSYARMKDERPGLKLVVAGCLHERYARELEEELPEVDYWIASTQPEDLDRVAEAELGALRHPLQTVGPRSVLLNEPGMAYLRISQGCDKKCSFCAIPGFKGRQASVPVEDLVAEARLLCEEGGAKELVLVAQDLCKYGSDIGYTPGLAGLIEALLEGTPASWIRFLYAYPFSLGDGVIDLMAREERVTSYLDMPFQHADTGVLKAMRRGHGGERFLGYLEDLRARVPGLVTRTTMLVGHPGESPEAFETCRDFVRRARFDWLGVFEYSDEDGTHAETLGEKVDPGEGRRRAQQLRRDYEEVRDAAAALGVGREQDALVCRREGTHVTARVVGQAPEVDGLTFFQVAEDSPVLPGDMVRVVPEVEQGMDLLASMIGGPAAPVREGLEV